jgi:hypothetical protein
MRLACALAAALLAAASWCAPIPDLGLNNDDSDDCMPSEAKECERAGFDGCRIFTDQQVNGTVRTCAIN